MSNEDINEALRKLQSVNYSIQSFSDSLLIYAPYDESNRYEFLNSFSFLFCFYSHVFLAMTALGVLFRGALTIGTAWEIHNNFLFGPAVHEAYELESKVAKHPRIVVSPALINLINKIKQETKHQDALINDVLFDTLIDVDFDGVPLLNYLSARIISLLTSIFGFDYLFDLLNKAFVAIKDNYKVYRDCYNTTELQALARKTELARRYYAMLLFFKRNEKPINDYLASIGAKPVCFDFDLLCN